MHHAAAVVALKLVALLAKIISATCGAKVVIISASSIIVALQDLVHFLRKQECICSGRKV